MSNITIPVRLWLRMGDLIKDMGNHHPNYKGTEAGSDLNVLGLAIKNCVSTVPFSLSERVDPALREMFEKATVVIKKHGGGRDGLNLIEQSIETSEKLLGLWAES